MKCEKITHNTEPSLITVLKVLKTVLAAMTTNLDGSL